MFSHCMALSRATADSSSGCTESMLTSAMSSTAPPSDGQADADAEVDASSTLSSMAWLLDKKDAKESASRWAAAASPWLLPGPWPPLMLLGNGRIALWLVSLACEGGSSRLG